MVKVNYHIHGTYSDGRATIAEYVQALRKGFEKHYRWSLSDEKDFRRL